MSFLKKVSTNVARAKQMAMVKMGQSDGTVDPEFTKFEGLFKEQYSKIKKFGKYVEKYQSAVKDLGTAQKGMAQMICDQYDSSDSMYHVATQLNENIVAQIDSFRLRMEQQYNETFHQPLSVYLGQYKIMDERINERNVRVVDMDRYNSEYRLLMSKPDTDPTRLQIAKEKAEHKTREYNGLNEELIKDIPRLLNDRARFFDGLFANMVSGKVQYFADSARALGLLSPNFQRVNRTAASTWPFVVTEPSLSSHGGSGKAALSSTQSMGGAPPSQQSSYNPNQMGGGVQSSFNPNQMGGAPPPQQSSFNPNQMGGGGQPMRPNPPAVSSVGGKTATSLFPFQGQDQSELSFQAGQTITIVNQSGEWWVGELNGRKGYFPSNYVKLN